MFRKLLLVALVKDVYTRKVADKLASQVRPRGIVSLSALNIVAFTLKQYRVY
ncbi:MAG: hypothetical protein JO072_11225 [Parafilimonas sp.]|nr:hypothetical protein [Parafilimonas sp.]